MLGWSSDPDVVNHGQEHFYLECNAALAVHGEGDEWETQILFDSCYPKGPKDPITRYLGLG